MTDLIADESAKLRRERVPFAIATVIAVRGSASARPGSKAIISHEGKNLAGWVGGGCAESFVCKQACESLFEKKPRIVTADLDDEIFGLGMPCGGVMDIYIEPVLPALYLALPSAVANFDSELTAFITWQAQYLSLVLKITEPETHDADTSVSHDFVRWSPHTYSFIAKRFPEMKSVEQSLVGIAASLASARGQTFLPMTWATCALSEPCDAPIALRHSVENPELWIVGRGRITEELARFAAQLSWPVTLVSSLAEQSDYPPFATILNETEALKVAMPQSALLVVASHHKGDPEWIQKGFDDDVAYVGLIASHHRVGLIKDDLAKRDLSLNRTSELSAPAGLAMDCRSPTEIALSLIVEMIVRRHG